MQHTHDPTAPRLMGSETEYTTRFSGSLDSRVKPSLVSHYAGPDALWLNNGARMYIDYGGLAEYATPECSSGSELLRQERIGEYHMRKIGDVIIRTLEPEFADLVAEPSHSPVYKRTGYARIVEEDPDGSVSVIHRDTESAGHHETYQTSLDLTELNTSHLLKSYLATRAVWSGPGLVAERGYELSQKSKALNFYGNSRTAHGEKQLYRHKGSGLVEIRSGEGSMSDWVIRNKFDMTSLVLRMIESGVMLPSLSIQVHRENVSLQTTSAAPLAMQPTESGRYSAVDMQRIIAEEALIFAEKHGAPQHEIISAREVLQACLDVDAYLKGDTDISTISNRIDWAAKLHKIQSRSIAMGDITCKNLVAVAHDLSWEDIGPESSARRWYRKHQPDSLTDRDIKIAMTARPRGRAANRVDIINHYDLRVRGVDWDIIYIADAEPVSVDKPHFS